MSREILEYSVVVRLPKSLAYRLRDDCLNNHCHASVIVRKALELYYNDKG